MEKGVSVLPKGFSGLVSTLAAKKVAARPVKPVRKTLLSEARAAVDRGELPPPLVFALSALGYERHSKAMRAFAAAGDREGLLAYPCNGVNTWSRALRGYRELLLEYLSKSAIASSLEKAQKAAKAAPAKTVAATASTMPITTKAMSTVKAKKRKAKATA